MANKKITLTVDDKDIEFLVTSAAYSKFVNTMTPTNKIQPAHNFVMNTVTDDSRKDAIDILKKDGAGLQLSGLLIEEFQPDLNITVKKLSNEPIESEKID